METSTSIALLINAILALITGAYVILTWKLSKSSQEQVQAIKDIHLANKIEKLNVYKSTLLAIKSALFDHTERTSGLRRELIEIQEKLTTVGELITARTSVLYDAKFLDGCRNRLLEYEDPNFEFFQLFSFYVNRCEEFNKDLSFERIIHTKQFFDSPEEYRTATREYITALLERITMLQELRDKIMPILEIEVTNYLPSYIDSEKPMRNEEELKK